MHVYQKHDVANYHCINTTHANILETAIIETLLAFIIGIILGVLS